MSRPTKRDISASIRQRLLDLSKHERKPFGEVLQYYAMERFLFRLSKSMYADRFILKGALLLAVWCSEVSRSTMDIDLLGCIDNSEEAITTAIRAILEKNVFDDGIVYHASTIKTEPISEDAMYRGVRVAFEATLAAARIRLKIDIGFGDSMYPAPQSQEFPVLLDQEAPRLLCYSRENAIAEKFEAMVKLRKFNSRMKDFFDIWLLSRFFSFDQAILTKALALTFAQRETEMDTSVVFSPEFSSVKQVQWEAFRKRKKLSYAPAQFSEVVNSLSLFLLPCVSSVVADVREEIVWRPLGPWERKVNGKDVAF
ncbi:MAG: nucleotidyl transferase AbiEii/AbiGii toxin family protein [Spirochaetae bacterium HGW-Spirochaetae-9]|nr:MAG: nucleotidyl transferase AbiEii/AbiGii toxin family protein [Spirochaetae bacterium HGW-Spirochaetae-9]